MEPMINVEDVNRLHKSTVANWHESPVENTYQGVLGIVCQQHSFNFLLWHEEDIARSRDVSDEKIAQVKRNIDSYNQQRNDWIEKIDDWISSQLVEREIQTSTTAPLRTETPGSVIDRLSIMSLRIYHMLEQLEREDATDEHKQKVQQKLNVCFEQQSDLSHSLSILLDEILSGKVGHKTYRQFKMYNDPTLNPYLYSEKLKKVA